MKTHLKIIDKIAKKHNSDIFEVFAVFLANLMSGNDDFEKVALKIFDLKKLDKKEIEILKSFFEMLKNEEFDDKFVENLASLRSDYKTEALKLAMFFMPLLPREAIESANPEIIKKSLKKYPQEIEEVIIKALESLSMLNIDELDEKYKNEILKNVIEMEIILYKIIKLLGDINESE
jgi:hypothetical protein